jgi:hypothetical protein
MKAFDVFWHMDTHSFHAVNEALLTLLPKKVEVMPLKDFMPILFIHIIGKLFSKVHASMLASKLNALVHRSQSAFIKGRYIQDNFWFTKASTKLLNTNKRSCLLLKINISRAFDSVAWPFLLEILRNIGFATFWCDWISVLLSTASTL